DKEAEALCSPPPGCLTPHLDLRGAFKTGADRKRVHSTADITMQADVITGRIDQVLLPDQSAAPDKSYALTRNNDLKSARRGIAHNGGDFTTAGSAHGQPLRDIGNGSDAVTGLPGSINNRQRVTHRADERAELHDLIVS